MWELIIVAVIVIAAVGMYNSLVRLREQGDGAWADIDVQLKRRYDLIPNLVETVKGYASHEKDTLERVVQARSSAMSAQGPAAKAEAEGMLTGALKSLFALSEAYPQLQAAEGFRDLQASLSQIEEQVAQARRYYNAVVRDFNTRTQTFPSVLIARAFGFTEREFFEVAESEKAVPKVDFGGN
ncbi:MAG TPA: LemA family protein [Longimicrobiales bacterium]|nr:LemA family protein [Longimicrobiales bacterium]